MKKKMLSILLCLCTVVGLLPTAALAAGNTITPSVNTLEGLRDAFGKAQSGDTVQLNGDIITIADMFQFIAVSKAVTLDLNGYTIDYKGTGTEINNRSGLFMVNNGGSLTLKGTSGGISLSGNYSSLAQVNSGGKLIVESGSYVNTALTDGSLITSYDGAVELKGGHLDTKSYQPLMLMGGTAGISGGSVSSGYYALVPIGAAVTLSGGTISSAASGSVYIANGGGLQMTGGKVENTSSGVALYLEASAGASAISGGEITASGGYAVFSGSALTVSGNANIHASSGTGVYASGTLTLTGGDIASGSGIALVNTGNLSMSGGTILSSTGHGLLNMAPAGKSADVSGGSIISNTNLAALNQDGGTLSISGGSVTTKDGPCAVYNGSVGTVNITGGTLSTKAVTIINNDVGTIKFSAGTIDSMINLNSSGSIVIDGGSVKTVQGATPKNSAGTALRQYPIQITGKANTTIAEGELTFTPAVSYGFAGVKTDAASMVYLWLPANETNAVYQTGTEEALRGGLAGAGQTTVLPNFVATVTLYRNDEVWAQNPRLILLSEKSTSGFGFAPENAILPDGNAGANGVFTFSGLNESKSYYVWAPDIIGYTCIGTAAADVLTKSNLSARVDYYTVTLVKGEGIASTYIPFNSLRKGTDMDIFASLENGYSFKHWLTTGTSDVFSTNKDAILNSISAPLNLTAVAELNVYDATVTVNKDNGAWANSGKDITLSTSAENKDTGKKTGTANGAAVGFTALDPRETYYIWADGVYTNQTLTNNTTAATLDYYTVTVSAGANIASVAINHSGSSLAVLRGGSATVTAAANAGDFVFSRWNETATGALHSTTAETVISNITAPISLTAVGASTTYTATVTVNKDGAAWTQSPRKIVLSTSQTEIGNVVGTLNNGVYTFSKLPGANTYYVWDAETVTYTGKSISAGGNALTLDYYSVNVVNQDTTNITAVTGGGVYLKDSSVTVTATPVQYYNVKWNGSSTGSSKTITGLAAKTDLTVTAELDVYTGVVTVQKNDTAWADFSGSITLSTDKENGATGKVTGTNASGVVSFANLDPRLTYFVWADGVYSGQTLVGKAAVVKYYTVSVTATGVAAIADQIVLAGKNATFTAVPNSGHDFIGWYDGGVLLSTDPAFALVGVTKATALTATASNTFDAAITVKGATGRSITLQSGGEPALSSFTGLDRAKTYKVLDGGMDTGFTVSKNAPNATLQYYTVALTKGAGIESVSGDGIYLAGSSVPVSATLMANTVFSGWSNGGNTVSGASFYTIPNLSGDVTLTASAAAQYSGDPIDIAKGNILIEDDGSGSIRIKQDGQTDLTGIAPNTNITLTGTANGSRIGVGISATCGVYLTLDALNITNGTQQGYWCETFLITSASGTVVLDLKNANALTTTKVGGLPGVADRPGLMKLNDAKLIIQSSSGGGSLAATGFYAPGISGGIGDSTATPATNVTINSGTVTCASANWSKENLAANLTVNGGNLTSNSIKGSVVVTGGNINAPLSGAINARGVAVTQKVYDYSVGLTITDGHGDAYGMTDVSGIDGKAYAYLDQNTYSDINAPASITVNGVTATASVPQSKLVQSGSNVSVTVTLSGTALKQGIYTVGLTSSSITAPTPVTKTVTVGASPTDTYTLSFTMPASDVSDLAVTLNFTETAKHTVTYSAPDATGGSVPAGGSYYEGQNFNVAGNTGTLTRTGYTFKGWSTDGVNIAGGSWSMPTADVNFTALWTANTYTLTFHNGGGIGNDTTQSFTHGAAAALTANAFTRAGYTFAGWAEAEGGAKVYSDGASASITANTDLYALWTPKTHTISFDANGGTGTMEEQSFAHGIAQELAPNVFTKAGYTFAGWKDTSTATYQNGASYTSTNPMTFTAQWTPIGYSVKFYANGGTGSIGSQAFTYDAAQNLAENTFSRTGYTFMRWNTAANGGGTSYADQVSVKNLTDVNGAAVTLYAVWQANQYTVAFNANDGAGSMGNQLFAYDAAATALSENSFTRPGYALAGWNTAKDGSGTSYADKASVRNLTADINGAITLYAQWTAEVYTLTLDANGGTGSMNAKQFASNSTDTVGGCDFTKAGYTFTGWNTQANGGGTGYAANAARNTLTGIQNNAVTLYAQWAANNYTVSFHANGGTGTMSAQPFTYDAPAALTQNSFTREGYLFVGWSAVPTGTTATYSDKTSVTNLTSIKDGSVTLYAVWRSNTYAVTFNANGGNGLMADLSVTNGESKALSLNGFTRPGYQFSGWNTRSDGKGASYADGATVSFTPDATGTVTLYAMWTAHARYNVSGTIQTDDVPAQDVSGATVMLKKGGDVIASTETNASGGYQIINILPGMYNLVVVKNGKTVTTLVTVAQADVIANVTLPGVSTTNSVLVVDGEAGQPAPQIVVGGLDALAETENANIVMTVIAKAEDSANAQQTAIKTAAGSGKQAQFLDITLKKGASDIGSTNATVLEIVQPFSFSGKTDVTVWRYHGATAEKLTKLNVRPTSSFQDGTYYADSQSGMIYVYAAKFSTYAVAYQAIIPASCYSVVVAAAANGSVKTDKTTATPGDTVTVTVSPNTGYALKSLTVTDAAGKSVATADRKNGVFTFAMPGSSVTVSAVFAKLSANPFVDVADNAYYYDAVLWALERGITTGTTATTFSPDMICTRAQTVTFLWRSMGSPEPTTGTCPFTDVAKGAYYYKAVLWACEKGITLGTSATTFSPNATVTRAQTVTFLWRTAGKPAPIATNPFGDVKRDAYYADAVLWAVSEGITTGTSSATFSPADGCTRAQIVTFLYRYLSE